MSAWSAMEADGVGLTPEEASARWTAWLLAWGPVLIAAATLADMASVSEILTDLRRGRRRIRRAMAASDPRRARAPASRGKGPTGLRVAGDVEDGGDADGDLCAPTDARGLADLGKSLAMVGATEARVLAMRARLVARLERELATARKLEPRELEQRLGLIAAREGAWAPARDFLAAIPRDETPADVVEAITSRIMSDE